MDRYTFEKNQSETEVSSHLRKIVEISMILVQFEPNSQKNIVMDLMMRFCPDFQKDTISLIRSRKI